MTPEERLFSAAWAESDGDHAAHVRRYSVTPMSWLFDPARRDGRMAPEERTTTGLALDLLAIRLARAIDREHFLTCPPGELLDLYDEMRKLSFSDVVKVRGTARRYAKIYREKVRPAS